MSLSRSFVTINLIAGIAFGCLQTVSAADASPTETVSPGNRLFTLIDATKFSAVDKEALKKGLSVAIPGATTHEAAHVSQETIDVQVKKAPHDYNAAVTLVFDVVKSLEDQTKEFEASETFQRIPVAERHVVSAFFKEVAEHYQARSLETLFTHYNRTVSVPAGLTPSVNNAEYRNLLSLAAKMPARETARRLVPGEKTYVVKSGDSLKVIARTHNVSPEAIVAANPGLVPTRMRPGHVLIIPSTEAGVTKSAALPKGPSVSSAQ